MSQEARRNRNMRVFLGDICPQNAAGGCGRQVCAIPGEAEADRGGLERIADMLEHGEKPVGNLASPRP